MSSFLSDPDFAVILSGINASPTKDLHTIYRPNESGSTVKADVSGGSSPGSSPSSPLRSVSPALARSPQMDMLSSAVEDNSLSPLRSRLSPNDQAVLRTRQLSGESSSSIATRLGADGPFANFAELVSAGKHLGQYNIAMDMNLLLGVIAEVEDLRDVIGGLKNKYTGAKVSIAICGCFVNGSQRTSQQYSEGLTVAGEEYDKELAHRRELEVEVKRLRAQVHSQTARLSVISGDERRQENMRRRSNDLAHSLTGLEKDISKLRAQRDISLAEVEELNVIRKKWVLL